MSNGLYLKTDVTAAEMVQYVNGHETRLRKVEAKLDWFMVLLIANLATAVTILVTR